MEVVVHNEVTAQKLQALREAGAAVLEISLKHWGGRITRDELRSLVVTGLDSKRWLHHPLRESQAARIEAERREAEAWRVWRRSAPDPFARPSPAPAAEEDDYAAQEALRRYGGLYRETRTAYLDVSHLGTRPTLQAREDAAAGGPGHRCAGSQMNSKIWAPRAAPMPRCWR